MSQKEGRYGGRFSLSHLPQPLRVNTSLTLSCDKGLVPVLSLACPAALLGADRDQLNNSATFQLSHQKAAPPMVIRLFSGAGTSETNIHEAVAHDQEELTGAIAE